MPPLIKRPRGISGTQLGFVIGVGVIAGTYIWRPAFEKYKKEKENRADK